MQIKKLWCVGLAFLCVTRAFAAQACAPMADIENAVRVVDESAVIVWNAKTQEEHFIRQASFDSKARDIGFLVPSPSVPKMASANADVFWDFEDMMVPEVQRVEKSRWYSWTVRSMFFGRIKNTFNAAGVDMSAIDDVEVLQSQSVAGYDATTLRARNVQSLNRWLKKHGYASSPGFTDWLEPYITKRWVITAFKIGKKNKKDRRFSSSLVRMSFKTPRPFFPYSEPQNAKPQNLKGKRSLRVFFISDARYKTTPQSFGKFASWPGKAVWSDSLDKRIPTTWLGPTKETAKYLALPLSEISPGKWLTIFEDNTSPRPGTRDMYFERDHNKAQHLPPIIKVRWVPRTIYLEPLMLVLGVLFVVGVWFVNRKSS